MTCLPGREYISRRAACSTGKLGSPLRAPPIAKRQRLKPTRLMERAAISPTCSDTDRRTGPPEGGVLPRCSLAATPHPSRTSLRAVALRLLAWLTLNKASRGDSCRE